MKKLFRSMPLAFVAMIVLASSVANAQRRTPTRHVQDPTAVYVYFYNYFLQDSTYREVFEENRPFISIISERIQTAPFVEMAFPLLQDLLDSIRYDQARGVGYVSSVNSIAEKSSTVLRNLNQLSWDGKLSALDQRLFDKIKAQYPPALDLYYCNNAYWDTCRDRYNNGELSQSGTVFFGGVKATTTSPPKSMNDDEFIYSQIYALALDDSTYREDFEFFTGLLAGINSIKPDSSSFASLLLNLLADNIDRVRVTNGGHLGFTSSTNATVEKVNFLIRELKLLHEKGLLPAGMRAEMEYYIHGYAAVLPVFYCNNSYITTCLSQYNDGELSFTGNLFLEY